MLKAGKEMPILRVFESSVEAEAHGAEVLRLSGGFQEENVGEELKVVLRLQCSRLILLVEEVVPQLPERPNDGTLEPRVIVAESS